MNQGDNDGKDEEVRLTMKLIRERVMNPMKRKEETLDEDAAYVSRFDSTTNDVF